MANRELYKDYDVNISDKVTISGLALQIFLNEKYYKNNIPMISKASILS